jgi:hypothetical protein
LGHVLLREGKSTKFCPNSKFFRPAATTKSSATVGQTRQLQNALHHRSIEAEFGLPIPMPGISARHSSPGSVRRCRRSPLTADDKRNFCVYPAVDNDHMFDKIRLSPAFQAARQAGITCQQRFAPYSQIHFD